MSKTTTTEIAIVPAHITSTYQYQREVDLTWGDVRRLGLMTAVSIVGPSLSDTTDDAPVISTIGESEKLEEVRNSPHFHDTPDADVCLGIRDDGRLYRTVHLVACQMVNGARYGLGISDTYVAANRNFNGTISKIGVGDIILDAVYLRG